MKRVKQLLIFGMSLLSVLSANGIAIVDANEPQYLRLVSSSVDVNVENQVAIITTTQEFRNEADTTVFIKYGFPLSESASAINLRWFVNSAWHIAAMAPTPQDTTLPGSGDSTDQLLLNYLGGFPLFYNIAQSIASDSLLIVELTYVELLPYQFGSVSFNYPNNYTSLQSEYLDRQEFMFTISSGRTIETVQLLNHTATSITNDGNEATVYFVEYEIPADNDYLLEYTLSLDELGLFSLSTFLPDSVVPDDYGRGFFVFIAEPDPSDTTGVINKVFTLIIDRSGSMIGNKIIQARNAASFIVEHLNPGDYFNIVDFSTEVTSFQPQHVAFNSANESTALNYIADIIASGGTNISGAFELAIPQFASASDTTANIIIFFTDGQATVGVTNTPGILNILDTLTANQNTEISIFPFGIGTSVNEQLLTLIASGNNGLAAFLGNDELEDRITEFYLLIQNPVLLNTNMTFSIPIILETYPQPLPNLYIGQQLVVAGRYNENVPLTISLSGTVYGQFVEYNYDLTLEETAVEDYQFLPKVWAKQKIEYLLIQYYSLDPESDEAEGLRQDIIDISIAYGVISPFTSYSGEEDGGGLVTEFENDEGLYSDIIPVAFQLMGNYPNPFNHSTVIRLQVNTQYYGSIVIKIFNSLGQLVSKFQLTINGSGRYEIHWDGFTLNGNPAPSGTYFYLIDVGDGIIGGRMTLLK